NRWRPSGRSSPTATAKADARRAIALRKRLPRNETHRERTQTDRPPRYRCCSLPGHELCRPASHLSAENKKSTTKLPLGRGHLTGGPWIDRDRRAQRPGQTLEAGFGYMMAVLAI